jgi:hypothetical protein
MKKEDFKNKKKKKLKLKKNMIKLTHENFFLQILFNFFI